MNPLAKTFLSGQGGGGSSGGGGFGVNALSGGGYCLGWVDPSQSNWPFIDMLKNGGYTLSPLNGGSYDANGWVTGIPNSTPLEWTITHNFGGYPYKAFPPGNYKARVTQAGWTVQFTNCQGITNITPAAVGQAFCTVPDLGDVRYDTVMQVTVTAPASGGPHSLSTLQVYLSSSEALLDAGNIAAPAWLADVAGAKIFRFKDWASIDGDKRRNATYAELPKIEGRSWQMFDVPGYGVPYKVQAKVAKEAGVAMMVAGSLMDRGVTFNASASSGRFTVIGTSVADDYVAPLFLELADGDEFVFNKAGMGLATICGLNFNQRYYARDVIAAAGSPLAGGSFRVCTTPGGTALTLTGDYVFAGSEQSNPLASKLYTSAQYQAFYDGIIGDIFSVYPGCPAIVADVGNECWNASRPYGYTQCANVISVRAHLDNPANTGSVNAGQGYAYALQRMWTAVEKFYPRSRHVRTLSGQWSFPNNPQHAAMYNYIDAAYFGGAKMADLIDVHCCAGYLYPNLTAGAAQPALIANGNFGAPLWPELANGETWFASDLESSGATGYTVGEIVHRADGNNYRCILNHTTSSATAPPNATYWALQSTSGLTGGAAAWTDAQWTEMLAGAITQWAATMVSYLAVAQTYRTSSTTIPGILYECGFIFGSATGQAGAVPVVQRFMAYSKTTAFRTFLQDYVTRYLIANNIKAPNWFLQSGEWDDVIGREAVAYGMKRAPHLADTPGKTYWKSISI